MLAMAKNKANMHFEKMKKKIDVERIAIRL